jgi:CBS domain-containing protein
MTAARAASSGASEAAAATVADVMHADCAALPASATVGDVRDWFAGSASRRLALLADAGRYAGALTPADVAGDVPHDRPATEVALHGRTVAPGTSAAVGREEALRSSARRVPVVDGDGRLLGVLAITLDARRFSCADAV